MADKRWKAQERRVMRWFGGERTPLSGSGSKMTRSDGLMENLYVENKDQRRHRGLRTLVDDTRAKAKEEGKLPIVTLTEPGVDGFLVVFCSADLDPPCEAVRAKVDGVEFIGLDLRRKGSGPSGE